VARTRVAAFASMFGVDGKLPFFFFDFFSFGGAGDSMHTLWLTLTGGAGRRLRAANGTESVRREKRALKSPVAKKRRRGVKDNSARA